MIARQMRYSPKDQAPWMRLERGVRLHDIGKIGVPDAVLQKPGKLTDDEFDKMKAHTTIGFNILSGLKMLTDVFVKAIIVCWLLANVVTTAGRLRFLAIVLMSCTVILAGTAVKTRNLPSGLKVKLSPLLKVSDVGNASRSPGVASWTSEPSDFMTNKCCRLSST